MPLTIEGVPETIPLSAVTAFATSLGVDPKRVRRMTVGLDSVELEVIATTPDGRTALVDLGVGPEIGIHRLTIRIDPDA